MILLLVALVVGVVFIGVLGIVARRGGWGAPVEIPRAQRDGAALAVHGTRMRMLVSLAVFVVLAVVVTLDPLKLQPGAWLGIGQSLGPGTAATVAILAIFARPLPAWSEGPGPRTAELTPRTGGSFGPRWGFALPLASAAVYILFLIATGLSSSSDSYGFPRSISASLGREGVRVTTGVASDDFSVTSSAGPYPGWFYGIPLIVMTLVLAAAVLAALWQIARAARPTSPGLYLLDDALRREMTRFVMLLSSAALLLYFAATLVAAGRSTSSVATMFEVPAGVTLHSGPDDTLNLVPHYVQPLYALGIAEMVVGAAFALIAIVLLVAAAAVATVRWAPFGFRITQSDGAAA